MLAAYLRGLLKPDLDFGMRSRVFENMLLESMAAHIDAERLHLNALVDASIASILTEDGKRAALRRINRQQRRYDAIQLMDLYGLTDGIRNRKGPAGQLSLLQVFQLMRNEGIIKPDDDEDSEESETT